MAGRRVGLVAVVVAVLLAAVPAAAQDAAPEAVRSVTVTPRTNLVDDQAISISGRNFRPGDFIEINLCRTGRPAMARCDFSSFDYTSVDEQGRWSLIFHVDAVIQTANGPWNCRPAGGRCDLRIVSDDGFFLRKGVTFTPGSPLASSPDVAATPNTDVVDGQILDLEGSGFHPQSPYAVTQCLAGASSFFLCDQVAFDAETDVDGNLDVQVSATALMHLVDGTELDCREQVCEFVAAPWNDGDFRRAGRAPVAFDEEGALQPPPELSVTPDTGLTGRQVVTVAGTGFRPLASVVVLQCKPTGDPFSACGEAMFAAPDVAADGTFSVPFGVRRRISFFEGGGPRDCTTRPCGIAAFIGATDAVRHPITFAPL